MISFDQLELTPQEKQLKFQCIFFHPTCQQPKFLKAVLESVDYSYLIILRVAL